MPVKWLSPPWASRPCTAAFLSPARRTGCRHLVCASPCCSLCIHSSEHFTQTHFHLNPHPAFTPYAHRSHRSTFQVTSCSQPPSNHLFQFCILLSSTRPLMLHLSVHGLRHHVAGLKDRVPAARGALCWPDGVSQLQLRLYFNPTQPDPLHLPQPRQACYYSFSASHRELYTLTAAHSFITMGVERSTQIHLPKTTSINSQSVLVRCAYHHHSSYECVRCKHLIVVCIYLGSCFTTSSVYTNIPSATAVTTATATHQVSFPSHTKPPAKS